MAKSSMKKSELVARSCAIFALVSLAAAQLIACSQVGTGNDGDTFVKLEPSRPQVNSGSIRGLPFFLVRQQQQGSQQQQQQQGASNTGGGASGSTGSSSSSSSGSGSSSGGSNKQNPDFFLIWMQPYAQMIPKPIMDMINQNVRPQTEQITEQVLSQVPGAEEFWSQLSQFQNTLSNMGGLQGVIGNNPLSSIMQNVGR